MTTTELHSTRVHTSNADVPAVNQADTEPLATQAEPTAEPPVEGKNIHGLRFWAIIASLAVTGMASAVEGTIITSALPTITDALKGGASYIWIPNAYLLSSVAVLPLFAQASDIFGRRNLLLGAVAVFILGSALSGAASSMGMLIAARTVQGLGGGGINLLMETVVTDIVALRERGKYMALVGIGSTVSLDDVTTSRPQPLIAPRLGWCYAWTFPWWYSHQSSILAMGILHQCPSGWRSVQVAFIPGSCVSLIIPQLPLWACSSSYG